MICNTLQITMYVCIELYNTEVHCLASSLTLEELFKQLFNKHVKP